MIRSSSAWLRVPEEEIKLNLIREEIQRFVRRQKLGFIATVCPDGTPNLSPKGTLTVWDDEHLVFADIRSPGTIANLRQNPSIEVNVVDPMVRKGWRFKGEGTILETGPQFEEILRTLYGGDDQEVARSRIRALVLIRVRRVLPLISPSYDRGRTEEDVRKEWENYWRTVTESHL
jgi:uncharacterized protein